MLGNNMFAYCNNNPVNCCDPTGSIPVLDGFIHRKVLENICDNNNNLSDSKTCVRYRDDSHNYTGKWGFCDLYNMETGEVWELKKNSTSRSCRTENAIAQLDNYINGTLLWYPDLELKKPYKTNISTTQFSVETLYCKYDVTYWDEGNGILRYDYTLSINKENIAKTAIFIGICALGYYAPAGAMGLGMLGPLLPA